MKEAAAQYNSTVLSVQYSIQNGCYKFADEVCTKKWLTANGLKQIFKEKIIQMQLTYRIKVKLLF
jgi:hypothetical protein